jgi:hypothetical protein
MKPWRPPLAAALALASTLACTGAQAHKASDAYVWLQVDGSDVVARMDVALRDLDRDLDLDADADDALTWKEVRTRWTDIAALARAGLRVEADGRRCAPEAGDAPVTAANAPALTTHSDGRYAVVRTRWHCAAPVQRLAVAYDLFARTDPTHRGIVRAGRAAPAPSDAATGGTGPATQLAVLSPGTGWHRFGLALPDAPAAASAPGVTTPASASAGTGAGAVSPTPGATTPTGVSGDAAPADDAADAAPVSLAGFVREGIHHILIGYDHILFLLSLLLPAVWVRRAPGPGAGAGPAASHARMAWRPAEALRPALANVLKVVTAFTVAHSITLALAVFDVVDPPSRWVESTIAASVVLAALNNLWPVISESRWRLTFLFGLVHGFGFASALKDAGLARGALVAPLVGFNVGVEIGQLCIVALVLPLAWTLRGTRTYRGAFAGGSLAIATVAGLWLVQRVFDLRLIAG